MTKEEVLEFPGIVTELLPNAMFRVKLENEHEIICPYSRADAQEPHPRFGPVTRCWLR